MPTGINAIGTNVDINISKTMKSLLTKGTQIVSVAIFPYAFAQGNVFRRHLLEAISVAICQTFLSVAIFRKHLSKCTYSATICFKQCIAQPFSKRLFRVAIHSCSGFGRLRATGVARALLGQAGQPLTVPTPHPPNLGESRIVQLLVRGECR